MTPKVRKDGRCVVCKGERTFNPQRGVPPAAYLLDPFCSRICAEKHYGTAPKSQALPKGRRRYYHDNPPKSRGPKYA